MKSAHASRCNLFDIRCWVIRPLFVASMFFCATSILSASAEMPQATVSTDVKASAKAVVDLLVEQKFSAVRDRFSESLKDKLSESQIRDGWKSIVAGSGAFRQQLESDAKKDQGLDIVDVKCAFEQRQVFVRFVFDPLGKIDGLWVTPQASESGSAASPEAVSAAKRVVEMMVDSNFSGVRKWFDSSMKESLSETQMRSIWENMVRQVGPFKSQIDNLSRKEQIYQVVDVRCQFEKAVVIVRVSFDPQGQIGGLWILPVG